MFLNYEGGLEAFVTYLDRAKTSAAQPADHAIAGERTAVVSRPRWSGTTATTRTVLCFTNNIPQRDGGTHLAGLRTALTRCIQGYAQETGAMKKREGHS